MKKWNFWAVLCMASLTNGGFFVGASLHSMRQGIPGADNQAALLFIPVLWLIAALVLILLNGYTLYCGIRIPKGTPIDSLRLFRLPGMPRKEKAGKIAWIAITGLLMLFGNCLFASKWLSAAYALSGGLLLVLLYAWVGAARQTLD